MEVLNSDSCKRYRPLTGSRVHTFCVWIMITAIYARADAEEYRTAGFTYQTPDFTLTLADTSPNFSSTKEGGYYTVNRRESTRDVTESNRRLTENTTELQESTISIMKSTRSNSESTSLIGPTTLNPGAGENETSSYNTTNIIVFNSSPTESTQPTENNSVAVTTQTEAFIINSTPEPTEINTTHILISTTQVSSDSSSLAVTLTTDTAYITNVTGNGTIPTDRSGAEATAGFSLNVFDIVVIAIVVVVAVIIIIVLVTSVIYFTKGRRRQRKRVNVEEYVDSDVELYSTVTTYADYRHHGARDYNQLSNLKDEKLITLMEVDDNDEGSNGNNRYSNTDNAEDSGRYISPDGLVYVTVAHANGQKKTSKKQQKDDNSVQYASVDFKKTKQLFIKEQKMKDKKQKTANSKKRKDKGDMGK